MASWFYAIGCDECVWGATVEHSPSACAEIGDLVTEHLRGHDDRVSHSVRVGTIPAAELCRYDGRCPAGPGDSRRLDGDTYRWPDHRPDCPDAPSMQRAAALYDEYERGRDQHGR